MAATSENHTFLEGLKIWLWWLKSVVKVQDLLLEHPFRLIALLGERVKSLGESIVEPRQNRNLLGGNGV